MISKSFESHFLTKKALVLLGSGTEKMDFFNSVSHISFLPFMSQCPEESKVHLDSTTIELDLMVIDFNVLKTQQDIMLFNNYKHITTKKIVICDKETTTINLNKLNYDFKIVRPLTKDKIESTFNLIMLNNKFNTHNNESLLNQNVSTQLPVDELIKKSQGNLKILVAEDNKMNQQVIKLVC